MEAAKETKFRTKVAIEDEDDARIHALHRESARYHTRRWKRIAMTCDIVKALGTWHPF